MFVPLEAEHDRQVSGDHVDDRAGMKKRGNLAGPRRRNRWFSIIGRADAEPILTPIRSALAGMTSRPESRKA